MKLREAENGYDGMSGMGSGMWSAGNKSGSYRTAPKHDSKIYDYDQESQLDPHIEAQLIQQAIDMLVTQHSDLIQDKTIRRHHIQMLIGKITSGEVDDLISLKSMVKGLKKRGIKVESKMKIKRSDLKSIIKEVISEHSINESSVGETGGQLHAIQNDIDNARSALDFVIKQNPELKDLSKYVRILDDIKRAIHKAR
jgi:hypothetical protein